MINKIIISLLIVLFLIGSFYFINNPNYQITTIDFQNYNFVPKIQLQNSISSLKNKNILIAILSIPYYKHKIYKNFPQVEKISSKIIYPKQIIFSLKEKKPWALFLTQEKNYIVANDGSILNKLSDPQHIPNTDKIIFIKGVNKELFYSNAILPILKTKIKLIISNLSKYVSEKNLQINLSDENNLVLLKDDYIPINIGTLENIEQKFINLNYFFDYIPPSNNKMIEYIDLRAPNKLIVKYED